MNQDPSIFPDIKLFNVRENLQKAVAWTAGMLAAGRTTELCLSEHIRNEPNDGYQPGQIPKDLRG